MHGLFSFSLMFVLISVNYIIPQGVIFGGGGQYKFAQIYQPPVTAEQRAQIQKELDANIQRLLKAGVIENNQLTKLEIPQFIFPLKPMNGLQDYGFHGISNFVDHDALYPNHLLDYNGGTRSYDLSSGYNHAGTDFFTWPFPWYKKQNDQVAVIASDSGVIIGKSDGNFDDNCAMGSGNWNAVYIRNRNGIVCWYGHMKKNSLTSKGIGASVAQGEYLGIVGSSGSSTGPHLHLEVYDSDNNLIDPFAGPSNPTIASSWWINQLPYYNSGINALMTHGAAPDFPPCPGIESAPAQDEFLPGSKIYFAGYYRDQRQGQVNHFTIYRPDGTEFTQWDGPMPDPYYAASWWYWWIQMPSSIPLGRWRFELNYNGTVYTHYFDIKAQLGIGSENKEILAEFFLGQNYPNPFNPATKFVYSLPVECDVLIAIYDIFGKSIVTLEKSRMSAGSKEAVFDASGLTSGVYVYAVNAISTDATRRFYKSRKFVLLK